MSVTPNSNVNKAADALTEELVTRMRLTGEAKNDAALSIKPLVLALAAAILSQAEDEAGLK